ncbi:MAG: hypothetical protein ACODAD_15415, partial [Planctomycetota bacterium]
RHYRHYRDRSTRATGGVAGHLVHLRGELAGVRRGLEGGRGAAGLTLATTTAGAQQSERCVVARWRGATEGGDRRGATDVALSTHNG